MEGGRIAENEEMPEGWEIVRLGDVVEVHDSKRIPLSGMERANRKGIYPYCGANGIIDYLDEYIFDGEYILLAEDGGAYGKFENTAYLMNGKFWVNNHAHIIKAINNKTSNSFLLYSLNFLDIRRYIVGSTRTKLNQEQLRDIFIPLPPLPEQRHIAEVLGTVDCAIQKVGGAIESTGRLKKGLMQRLLTRGIGHERFNFCKEVDCKIPEEWTVVKMGDIADDFVGGGTPSTSNPDYWNGKIAWMTSSHINGRTVNSGQRLITEKGLKESSTHLIPKGNLLVATRVGIGKAAINLIDVAISQDLTGVIINKDKVNADYIYWFLRINLNKLKSLAQGSTIKGILKDDLANLKVPLPPLPEQHRIAEVLSAADRKLELERRRKEKLERVKKGLMNELLTGRKRIKVEE